MTDRVDRRVLGALQFQDGVTGARIPRPLVVTGDGLDIQRNRSGLHVIFGAAGLEPHADSFLAPPSQPPAESLPFTVSVTDPRDEFMPQSALIELPRAFDPENDVFDLMEPIDITLASSPMRVTSRSWAVLGVRVEDADGNPLRGALVEASTPAGVERLGWGITNDQGETLVAIAGLPALREIENDPDDADDDEIATAETRVDIIAVIDPDLPWPVDPTALADDDPAFRRSVVLSIDLTPGRTDSTTLVIV